MSVCRDRVDWYSVGFWGDVADLFPAAYDCLLHFVQWEVPTSNTLINANAIAGFTTAGSSFYRYYGWMITVRFHYYYLLCGY
jgi:hypothetical protein